MLRAFVCLASFVIVSLALPAPADTLNFGAVPHRGSSHDKLLYGEVAQALSDALGIEVRFVPVENYQQAIRKFATNEIQLGWFGGLTGVLARGTVPGSSAIAQGFEDQFFKTLFIANKSVKIRKDTGFPLEIAGLSFAFGDPYSTSGRLIPEHHIREQFGEPSEKVFKRIGFSGLHAKTILWVEEGIYDVGAVSFTQWYASLQSGLIETEKVRIIWESPPYANYHFVIRGDIEERFGKGFTKSVSDAILSLNSLREVLRVFDRSHFVTADNSDFETIEHTADELGLHTTPAELGIGKSR